MSCGPPCAVSGAMGSENGENRTRPIFSMIACKHSRATSWGFNVDIRQPYCTGHMNL